MSSDICFNEEITTMECGERERVERERERERVERERERERVERERESVWSVRERREFFFYSTVKYLI